MGLGYTSAASLNDYIRNKISGGVHDSVKSFSAGLELFGGVDYQLSKLISMRLDYSYFFKNSTYYLTYLSYNYFYFFHQPFLFIDYIYGGKNYNFKFGFGIGYHFAQLQETLSESTVYKYNASGPALRGEAIFSAKLSKNVGTYFSGFCNGSFLGNLKDNNNHTLKNTITSEDVNLKSFGIGVRVGFTVNIF